MKIIGLTGRAGSGKDTAAAIIAKAHGGRPHRVAFADPIRFMLIDGLCLDSAAFVGKAKEEVLADIGASPRKLMQTLGDWGRAIGPGFWVRALLAEIDRRAANERELMEPEPAFIVTDVRFDNEAQALRECGAKIIKIVRHDAPTIETHRSEAGISAGLIDYTISNDGTVDALADSVLRLVNNEGLL